MLPTDAQGTIEKFMRDFGETKEEAMRRFEAINRTPLPAIVRTRILEQVK